MDGDIRVEWRSAPKLLRGIRGLVRCYVADHGFSDERCDEIVLAVDEACTNSIRHAYHGAPDRALELVLRSNDMELVVELRDQGKPAPWEVLEPKEVKPPDLDNLTPGGLGIQLMYSVFDEVTFTPGEHEGNTVIMRLSRSGT
jgi:anti-sigma regulatory factor (Ser/Thr protein kinase)